MKKKKENNNKATKSIELSCSENDKYKSSSLLLDSARQEYQNDLGTIDSLYTRVGITIAFVIVLVGFQLDNAMNVFNADLSIFSGFLYYLKFCSLILFGLSLLINFICILIYLSVIAVGKLETISLDGFIESSCDIEINKHAWYLASTIVDCLRINKPRISGKLKRYNIGIVLTMISVVFVSINAIVGLI